MLKNVRFVVTKEQNPYRKGSFKHVLFAWALEKKEFTKEEFVDACLALATEHEYESKMAEDVDACLALATEHEYESKMAEDVFPKAWWNEFANKHKVFVFAE
jgi:hypothetical protein